MVVLTIIGIVILVYILIHYTISEFFPHLFISGADPVVLALFHLLSEIYTDYGEDELREFTTYIQNHLLTDLNLKLQGDIPNLIMSGEIKEKLPNIFDFSIRKPHNAAYTMSYIAFTEIHVQWRKKNGK